MQIKTVKIHRSKEEYRVKQDYHYKDDDYWDWSIWIDSSESGLNKIENVIYNLHYTFPNPVRIINTRENKFKLKASGWGTFIIYVRINFKDETVTELEHELELYYPSGDKNEE
ncbi:pYEATS domain-containing protein [Mariniflexile sp. AS56]|uniref:pYEATS domain-containing protein n=1 Tax=Mariniflexile sp. AS56 TaxID=3063957 RepID=UPI0026EEC4A8|nr:pYEATS domain-containing protein [Mariniflexile sp. AS56]MDO7173829.1 hypothetical protein [Mariniflexile sp. AS56]